MRRTIIATIAAAILALTTAGAAIAVASSATAGTKAPARCATGYNTGVTHPRESLQVWALRHNATISNVLASTLHCGGPFDLRFAAYLNRGYDRKPIRATVRLWAHAAPPVH